MKSNLSRHFGFSDKSPRRLRFCQNSKKCLNIDTKLRENGAKAKFKKFKKFEKVKSYFLNFPKLPKLLKLKLC